MPITINLNLKYINRIGSILTDLIAIIVKILVFIFKILSLLAQKVEQAATERLLVKKFLFDVVGVDN